MAACDTVCDQLHLPIQAASNDLLSRMNRKYTKEQYLELVKRIQVKIPNISISTDVIIGFPGETEEDVDQLIELIHEVKFASAYTFIYSPRKGTPAAEMEDQIPDDVKSKRFERMLKEMNGIISAKNKTMKDKVVEVLVEGPSQRSDEVMMGRTSGSKVVNFPGTKDDIGKMIQVKITDPKSFSLVGVKLES